MSIKTLGRFLLLPSIVSLFLFTPTQAQIYKPEGINMPGAWNSWTNSNDSVAMGAFKMKYRSLGGGQYTTRLNVRESGGNLTGGTYEMLFTSGPADNQYHNKWGNTTLVLNNSANLVKNSENNNSVTVANGFYYTFIFNDNNYENTQVAMLRTSGIPVSIDSVLGLPTASVTAGESVSLSIKLSAAKSAEELIYLVYSADSFATSDAVLVSDFNENNVGTALIPGQAYGISLEFYVMSTSVQKNAWGNLRDHFTLHLNNNNGANYTLSFGAIANLLSPLNNATKVEPELNLSWSAIDGVTSYQVQLSKDSDSNFEHSIIDSTLDATQITVSKGLLEFNSSYRWRVKEAKESASWTSAFHFQTRPTIGFATLLTGSAVIQPGDSIKVEGKAYIADITSAVGETADLKAWIGVSTTNSAPNSWDESSWKEVSFSRQDGNDDVFSTYIGKNLPFGSYYFSFRYEYKTDGFVYGGSNITGGGFWDVSTAGNSVLVVDQIPVLSSPLNKSILIPLKPVFVWEKIDNRIYDIQITLASDVGFTSPSTSQANITDTTFSLSQNFAPGTEYIWRLRLGGENPGAYSEPFKFKTRGNISFQNLQFVDKDTIVAGNSISAYSQIFIGGYTSLATPATEVKAWIGANSENTNPATWPDSVWKVATLNPTSAEHNNDEYSLNFGSDFQTGTYFIASKFSYLEDEPVFGGFSNSGGGVWSETNTSFTLHVIKPAITEVEYVLASPLNNSIHIPLKPAFTWNKIENHVYDIQITLASDARFASPIVSQKNIVDTTFSPGVNLAEATDYIWRIRLGGENPAAYSQLFTFKTRSSISFQNLQFVDKDTILVGNSITAYSQLFIGGYTSLASPATEVKAWIGANSEDTNPATWPDSVWKVATLNPTSAAENNDEYSLNFGSDFQTGTYFIASKFSYLEDEAVFGGFSNSGGGAWSETNGSFTLQVVQITANEIEHEISSFELYQNYPNPFNPSTQIPFELAKTQQVRISIYDVLGRKVQVLLDKMMPQGKHQIVFNAAHLGSGTYLIRMETATKMVSKVAVLFK